MGEVIGAIGVDENGQYLIGNADGGMENQDFTVETAEDLRNLVDTIETRGRAEIQCALSTDEAIAVLRQYNDTYKSTMKSLESTDSLIAGNGLDLNALAFVLHCSDGTLPLKLQKNNVTYKNEQGQEVEQSFPCFEHPPANDSVDVNVLDIRKRLNDTMYFDSRIEGGSTEDDRLAA